MWCQFARAIEVKQVAQQEAERSKFVVMKSEQVRAPSNPPPTPPSGPLACVPADGEACRREVAARCHRSSLLDP